MIFAITEIRRGGKYFHQGHTVQIAVERGEFIFRNGFSDPAILRADEVAGFCSSLEAAFAPKAGNYSNTVRS